MESTERNGRDRDGQSLSLALEQVFGRRLREKGARVCSAADTAIGLSLPTVLVITVPADPTVPVEVEVTTRTSPG